MSRVPMLLLLLLAMFVALPATAKDEEDAAFSSSTLSGLAFRELGPALTSGRIADIAVHPTNHSEWMVATASGGVWHTINSGTTWTPVFDGEGSYSIGCVTYDPTNPLVVWVGTGENNSQRSVSFGDGVYRSMDGGKSWKNMGLADSQHIGRILVHPENGNIVYVAAQGPLWNAGGDRGLYKTTDGGETWENVLDISEDTGISDVVMDPRDPDVLYASSYQRRRHVWTLVNGGPEGGIHKSTDGGASWTKLERGLPEGDIGRIGLGIGHSDGNIVYAIIEAAGDGSGFYRSVDAGVNWNKMSGYVAGSPQYYNELIVSPHDPDVVYSNDTWLNRTEDGGRNWTRINDGTMHVDNHAVWIDPDDPDHLIAGNDGGVYESFDRSVTWSFKWNLSITQFYKIAIDDDFPFYNVYGGTQDNNTIGGPTRTTSANGIRNDDWFITLGGDGFEPAVEPGNPDIVYTQWQYGNLHRYDRKTGENIDVQPQPEDGDEPFVWNWSSAVLISPHDPARLYFGGNFLFRSEDRGDTWTRLGGNKTRQIDRNQLEIMGRVWSVDSVAKNMSTSQYGNIVSIDESPLREDLLYIGTDDGLIWMSADGGTNWERHDSFKGVPDMSYVTALTASNHVEDRVYATFDNHKKGDFTPYVLRSDNRGKSWKSIAGNLPDRGQVHDIVEDHVDADLLFVGTEFGVYFTRDGGENWIQLKGKLPTVACRDLEIQRRENDLVVGTFGRGFWVLDDYSPLRSISAKSLEENEAALYPVRDAWMFFQRSPLGLPGKSSMGHQVYMQENPPVAATFTYWLGEGLKTRTELRQASEKEAWQEDKNLSYPSWDELQAEDRENAPKIVLTVRDSQGQVVRRIDGPVDKGLHRVHWDFRYPSPEAVDLDPPDWKSPWDESTDGAIAMPGTYSVELSKIVDGQWTELAGPVEFQAKSLAQASLPATDAAESPEFQREVATAYRAIVGATGIASEARGRIRHLRQAIMDTPGAERRELLSQLDSIDNHLLDLQEVFRGDATVARRSEATLPGLAERINRVVMGYWTTSSAPTTTMRDNYGIVARELPGVIDELRELLEVDLAAVESAVESAGGPWTPGRMPVFGGGE